MIRSWMSLLLLATTAQAGTISWPEEHDRLLSESSGYFAHAGGTGGQGGEVVYVTHLGDSGPGSLRWFLESPETLIVLFEDGLNGTINLLEHIKVKSNKTLWGRHRDGTGADILIHPANTKAAFTLNGEENFIFSNLKADANFGVNDSAPDWIRIVNGGTLWVDHVTAIGDGSQAMDGFVDVHTGGVTLSWNRIEDWDNVHRLAAEPDTTTVTLHHNLFIGNRGRMPRTSLPDTFAHVFNNVYQNWGDHATKATAGEMVIENNIFAAGGSDEAIAIRDAGRWAGSGNVFLNGAVADPQSAGVFVPPYAYTLDPTDTLRADLENAGWQEFFIPEPSSWVLFGIGILFFSRGRR